MSNTWLQNEMSRACGQWVGPAARQESTELVQGQVSSSAGIPFWQTQLLFHLLLEARRFSGSLLGSLEEGSPSGSSVGMQMQPEHEQPMLSLLCYHWSVSQSGSFWVWRQICKWHYVQWECKG